MLRYDHRDTGRSSACVDERPYGITDLAADAIAVLDAFCVPRAHVVGMSMGGLLVQLLLLDHPDRIASATLFCTGPLAAGGPDAARAAARRPDPALLRMWAELDDPRDTRSELAWRVEHWRVLNGPVAPFDAARVPRAGEAGDRARRHPADADRARPDGHRRVGCAAPSWHASRCRCWSSRPPRIPRSRRRTRPRWPMPSAPPGWSRIPGMGHAISRSVLDRLAEAIVVHTAGSRPAPG